VTGTELEVVTPAATEILGPEADRLATLHTNARTDHELLAVWLKSHADGSPHTVRVYRRVGERFLGALASTGSDLRRATVEDVQPALDAIRTKEDGSPVRPATVNTYVAAVKSFLGFAHLVSATFGHADLKTTSVYAHARPGESSGRYLKTKFLGLSPTRTRDLSSRPRRCNNSVCFMRTSAVAPCEPACVLVTMRRPLTRAFSAVTIFMLYSSSGSAMVNSKRD
jgi:Phage integrase, N-terminal SAM-like domain